MSGFRCIHSLSTSPLSTPLRGRLMSSGYPWLAVHLMGTFRCLRLVLMEFGTLHTSTRHIRWG
uniref:Uncharacterized protein n=1 Tax=Arundo donax TaxID=35708 RepID=A0A0A9EFU4_ARUDO